MFLVCTHLIKIGRVFLPLIANILFVSINFTLEKVFVTFFRTNELPRIKLFKWNIFCDLIFSVKNLHTKPELNIATTHDLFYHTVCGLRAILSYINESKFLRFLILLVFFSAGTYFLRLKYICEIRKN